MKRTSVEQVRVNHRLKVLRSLRDGGRQSRVQLCETAELTPTTMSKLVAELIREGLVEESGTQALAGAGRPRLDLRLVPQARCVISLSVRPDGLQWAVVQLDLGITRRGAVPHAVAQTPPEDTLDAMVRLLQDVIGSNPDSQGPLGLVVTLPGAIDESMRVCKRAPLIGWTDVRVADRLQAPLRLPVLVHNNARAMALAELRHVGPSCEPPLLYVQARHGIGAALIDSVASVLHGHYLLSELGNIPVQPHATDMHHADPLRLGAVLNEQHLRRQLGITRGDAVREMETRASQGDQAAQHLQVQTLHYLGIGLGIAVDLLNPRTIVLGGIYAQASDAFLEALLSQIRRVAFSELTPELVLRRSALVGQGDLIGAAMIGMEHFMELQQ